MVCFLKKNKIRYELYCHHFTFLFNLEAFGLISLDNFSLVDSNRIIRHLSNLIHHTNLTKDQLKVNYFIIRGWVFPKAYHRFNINNLSWTLFNSWKSSSVLGWNKPTHSNDTRVEFVDIQIKFTISSFFSNHSEVNIIVQLKRTCKNCTLVGNFIDTEEYVKESCFCRCYRGHQYGKGQFFNFLQLKFLETYFCYLRGSDV